MSNTVVRYSDEELTEFKALIDKKLANAQEQLNSLQEQILEITENTSDEHGGDWMDDSSINNDMEMLNNMAIRQRRYIKDLENALIRIRNKAYGICIITGELIDKKRLLAVPTTTKSLAAKTQLQNPVVVRRTSTSTRPASKPAGEKKVITKIIRKSPTKPVPPPVSNDFDDDDDEFGLGELYEDTDDEIDKSIVDLDEFTGDSSDDVDVDFDIDSNSDDDDDDDL